MNYKEFKEKLLEEISRILANQTELRVEAMPCVKRGKEKDAITFFNATKEDMEVGVTTYPEDIYATAEEQMKKSDADPDIVIQDIAWKITREMKRHLAAAQEDYGITNMMDKEYVLKNVAPDLVNMKRYEKSLEDGPSMPIGDMALRYGVIAKETASNVAFIPITNKMLETTGITADELHKQALQNAKEKFPVKPIRLDRDRYGIETNGGICHATAILYEGCLKAIAGRLNGDLLIVPLSTEGVLVVREGTAPVEELIEHLVHVNETQPPEFVLSQQILRYDRKEDTLDVYKEYKTQDVGITDFMSQLADALQARINNIPGNNITAEAKEDLKPNDQSVHRLFMTDQDDPTGPNPILDVDVIYESYRIGMVDMEGIVEPLANMYEAAKEDAARKQEWLDTQTDLTPYLGLRLLSEEFNERYLKTVPSLYVGNGLYLILTIDIPGSGEEQGGVFVTNEMVKRHQYDAEKMLHDALDNAWKHSPPTLRTVEEEIEAESGTKMPESGDQTSYVLATGRPYGAAALYYPGMLEKIAKEFGEDFYVLPFSTDKLVLVKSSKVGAMENLKKMVREETKQLYENEPDQVLSSYMMKYSCKTGELTQVAEADEKNIA